MVSCAPHALKRTSSVAIPQLPANYLQAGFTNNQSDKSNPLTCQAAMSEPFNEQLDQQLKKMDRIANQLALIADMMSFQPGQHTDAWNEHVAKFMKEAEGCRGLVQNHKKQAHVNMVVALMMSFVVSAGIFLLGGYFFVKDIFN